MKKEIETTRLAIRVTPNAKHNELVELVGPLELRVKIRAPARDDKANIELIRFLANLLGCRGSELVLLSGEKSRSKVIAVLDHGKEQITEQLATAFRQQGGSSRIVTD